MVFVGVSFYNFISKDEGGLMKRLSFGWILISIAIVALYFSSYEDIEIKDGYCAYARITGWGVRKEFECLIAVTNIVKITVVNRGCDRGPRGFRGPRYSVVVVMTDGRQFEIKGLAGRGGASKGHCDEILHGLEIGHYYSRVYCNYGFLYILPFSILFVFCGYMRFPSRMQRGGNH